MQSIRRQNMKLTFEEFVQGLVDKFQIPEDLVHIKSPENLWQHFSKHGWHFSQPLSGCSDYSCSWEMPSGEHNTVGGGIINYTHNGGYTIDCRGTAIKLTLEEVGKLFRQDIPGKGTFVGSF